MKLFNFILLSPINKSWIIYFLLNPTCKTTICHKWTFRPVIHFNNHNYQIDLYLKVQLFQLLSPTSSESRLSLSNQSRFKAVRNLKKSLKSKTVLASWLAKIKYLHLPVYFTPTKQRLKQIMSFFILNPKKQRAERKVSSQRTFISTSSTTFKNLLKNSPTILPSFSHNKTWPSLQYGSHFNSTGPTMKITNQKKMSQSRDTDGKSPKKYTKRFSNSLSPQAKKMEFLKLSQSY